MSDTIKESSALDADDLSMLPDGWADGDNIFDMSSWTGGAQADASDDNAGNGDEATSDTEASEADDLTTVSETEETEDSAGTETEPTTPGAKGNAKHKFRATVDHKEQDVELDDTDLPGIWQKAQVTDRVQAKLNKYSALVDQAEKTAKLLGYESAKEMLDASSDSYRDSEVEKLVNEGTPRAIAEDYIERKVGSKSKTEAKQEENGRDFKSEAELVLQIWPELKGKTMPDEVISECVNSGRPLAAVYREYLDKQKAAVTDKETKALKKDNKILKQNAEAASRAPVRGVARGGATDSKGSDDPFLKGFFADD